MKTLMKRYGRVKATTTNSRHVEPPGQVRTGPPDRFPGVSAIRKRSKALGPAPYVNFAARHSGTDEWLYPACATYETRSYGRRLLAALLIVSTLAAALAGFLAGAASDRLAHRRLFVVGGGLAMAAALVGLGLSSSWVALVCAQLVFGTGHGVHAASVAAMTAETLPDRDRAGQDLGVMNMAIALPQGLAPGAAVLMIALGSVLPAVFVAAGLLAALGCVVLLG